MLLLLANKTSKFPRELMNDSALRDVIELWLMSRIVRLVRFVKVPAKIRKKNI